MRDIYINSNQALLTKFSSSNTEFKKNPSMEHVSNDHKDSMCNEIGYPLLSLKESQWKPRQQKWSLKANQKHK